MRHAPDGLVLPVATVADSAEREGAAAGGAAGGGREVVIPRGASPQACPVRAPQAWLAASGCRFGPVFRKVDRWDNAEHARLGADAVHRVLLRRRAEAARAGQGPRAARRAGRARDVAPRAGGG